MRHLVRDDVVREAGEHPAPRQVAPGRARRRLVVAEAQLPALLVVEGVLPDEGVRPQHEPAAVPAARVGRVEAPREVAAQRAAELGHHARADGVDHLLVEPRVGRRRVASAAEQDVRMVEIDGGQALAGRPVLVVDGQQRADRPRLERLVGHVDDRHAPVEA